MKAAWISRAFTATAIIIQFQGCIAQDGFLPNSFIIL